MRDPLGLSGPTKVQALVVAQVTTQEVRAPAVEVSQHAADQLVVDVVPEVVVVVEIAPAVDVLVEDDGDVRVGDDALAAGGDEGVVVRGDGSGGGVVVSDWGREGG